MCMYVCVCRRVFFEVKNKMSFVNYKAERVRAKKENTRRNIGGSLGNPNKVKTA